MLAGHFPVGGSGLCIHGCTMQTLLAQEAEVTGSFAAAHPVLGSHTVGGVSSHPHSQHALPAGFTSEQTQGAAVLHVIREQL